MSNREIKFRVWLKDECFDNIFNYYNHDDYKKYLIRLLPVTAIQFKAKRVIVSPKYRPATDEANCYLSHNITSIPFDYVVLEQFTGLIDKTGKEIFEGDIVKWTSYKDYDDTALVERIGYIAFENLQFICRADTLSEHCYTGSCFEVIGNIHEDINLVRKAKSKVIQDIFRTTIPDLIDKNFKIIK